jgi:hypothetical protein
VDKDNNQSFFDDISTTLDEVTLTAFVKLYAEVDGVKSWTDTDWANTLKSHFPKVIITEELINTIRASTHKDLEDDDTEQETAEIFNAICASTKGDDSDNTPDEDEEYDASMGQENTQEIFDDICTTLKDVTIAAFVEFYAGAEGVKSWTDSDWENKLEIHFPKVKITDELLNAIRELSDDLSEDNDNTDNDEDESSNDEDSNCTTKKNRKRLKLSQTSMLSAKDNNDSERSLKFYLIQETKDTKKFKAGFSTQTESSLVKRYKTLIKSAFKVHTCILNDFMNGSERVYDIVLKHRIKNYLCSREESDFDDFSLQGIQMSQTYAYDAFRHEHYNAENTPEILQIFMDIKNMTVQEIRDEAFELERCSSSKSIFLSRRIKDKLPWSKEFLHKGTLKIKYYRVIINLCIYVNVQYTILTDILRKIMGLLMFLMEVVLWP